MSAAIPYWRLSAFYFCYFGLLGAWLPYWPLYLQDLGYGAQAIGYLAAIVMVTKVIAPNVWGWLADRSGRRMFIIRGGSLAALLIFLGVFLGDGFLWLALIVAGYSFFWNAVLAQFEVVTLSHLPGRYQRYSQIRVWGSVGFIVAVALLGWLFDSIAVSWLPWFLAALLAGIWLSSLSVGEQPRPQQVRARPRRPLGQLLRQRPVIAFFLACCLLQVSHGPYYTFFSVYLQDYGYSRTQIGLLWSLGVLAEVIVFLVMHRLLKRFSLRLIMLASLALAVLRWLLIAWTADVLWLLLFAQCLHAATFGSYHAYAVETVRDYFGGGNEGQGMALYSGLSFGAGGAIGAVLSGWLWGVSPAGTFVMAALVAALAWLVAWWGRQREPLPEPSLEPG